MRKNGASELKKPCKIAQLKSATNMQILHAFQKKNVFVPTDVLTSLHFNAYKAVICT